eukprot:7334394-Lingulodinium_polyedra.AAC.1
MRTRRCGRNAAILGAGRPKALRSLRGAATRSCGGQGGAVSHACSRRRRRHTGTSRSAATVGARRGS